MLDERISWKEKPLRRLFSGLVVSFLWAILTLTILNLIMIYVFNFNTEFFTVMGFVTFSISTTIISVLITGFFNSREFLINWRKSELDAEKLRSEVAQNQYNNLKNQVNPHFLFNSFNSLSSLILENQDLAVKYTKKLSEVYRYILDSNKHDWVELEKELEFCRSFVYLHKIRFENNLNVNIENIKKPCGQIIPCSIQILIENAIKHNEISDEKPLKVNIEIGKDMVLVSNHKQLKNLKEKGTGTGLQNIDNQYKLLLERGIEIKDSKFEFSVGIPINSYESNNH